jgi:HK97 family phage major capsid protein
MPPENNTLRILDKQTEVIEKIVDVLDRQPEDHRAYRDGKEIPHPFLGDHRSLGEGHVSPRSMGENRALGEFCQAVVMAGTPGNPMPEMLVRATGMSEGVGSEGGFLLSTDLSMDLLKSVFETGKLGKLCRKFTITSNSNSLELPAFNETSRATGSRLGGIRGYWLAEGGTKLPSRPDLRNITLNLKKMIALTYLTDELLQDAAILGNLVRTAFSDEFSFMLDDGILNGSGAGQMLGVLNSPALVAVAKESGQAADTVVYENVLAMYSRQINPQGSTWVINKDVIPQLYSFGITVGFGGTPAFMPAGGISGVPYNTLFGRPIIEAEQAATLGDEGDISFIDFGQYVMADKGTPQMAESIHVQFLTDETAIRGVYRIDGSPVLASAITPYKGAEDLSFYVTLAERA